MQFLTCARPEERSITLRDKNGNDSIIRYPCSLLSTWYKAIDDPEWHYMATIRHSGESHYYNTWYSFIENWADTGGELFRRAYYVAWTTATDWPATCPEHSTCRQEATDSPRTRPAYFRS